MDVQAGSVSRHQSCLASLGGRYVIICIRDHKSPAVCGGATIVSSVVERRGGAMNKKEKKAPPIKLLWRFSHR
jgi:hypothetical protein